MMMMMTGLLAVVLHASLPYPFRWPVVSRNDRQKDVWVSFLIFLEATVIRIIFVACRIHGRTNNCGLWLHTPPPWWCRESEKDSETIQN